MAKHLFMRILEGVRLYDDYFEAQPDATSNYGFSSYQKCIAAIRMLTYGVAGDLVDEYLRMSESTCLESMYRFCKVFAHERVHCLESMYRSAKPWFRCLPGVFKGIKCCRHYRYVVDQRG